MADEIDIKTALKELETNVQKGLDDFKSAHAEETNGKVDALVTEKTNKIATQVGDLVAKSQELALKLEAQEKANTELETAMQRLARGGVKAADAPEAKALEEFGLVLKADKKSADINLDQFKAYNAAFSAVIKGDVGVAERPDEQKALSVGGDTRGGYLVPQIMSNEIIGKVFETSPMRSICSTMTIGGPSIKFPVDRGEFGYGWVGETEPRAKTSTSQFGEQEISVHELYAYPEVTQNMLDDSGINIESWVRDKVVDRFARGENDAFLNGDGVKKPRGLLSYATAATADDTRAWGSFQHIDTGANGAFAASDPADVMYDIAFELKNAYRTGSRWLMSRRTMAAVLKLQDGQGNYLWSPNITANGIGLNLLGHPVTEAEDMPEIATDSLSIAFGNFARGYRIVDRLGIRLLVDPYTAKPLVGYYFTKRVGGDVIDFEAVKFLKFAA